MGLGIRWLRKAAEQGNFEAQLQLGRVWEEEEGAEGAAAEEHAGRPEEPRVGAQENCRVFIGIIIGELGAHGIVGALE